MHNLFATTAITAMMLGPAAAQSITEQSVQNARVICTMFDNSEMLTQPCDYSIWGSTITAVMAVSVDDARLICSTIQNSVSEAGLVFEEGWQINIRHPFSGENNIATCPLG